MRSPLLRLVLATLVGVTLLWRGLLWFNDDQHQREVDATRAAADATAEAARREGSAAVPTGPTLPPPTEAELAMLLAGDTTTLADGVRLLSERRITETLVMAVEAALAQAPSDEHRALVGCLKARVPGRDGLMFALGALPSDEKGFSNPTAGVACLVDAVAVHAGGEPALVRMALLPAIHSPRLDIRTSALEGLGRVTLPDFPLSLQLDMQSPNVDRRRQALRAALALGALHVLPGLVERALVDEDSGVREIARVALYTAPEPAAARIAARGLAAWPGDPYMQMLVERREKGRADVSPALADVALDERASTYARVAALAWLTRSGDHGVIPMIEPLEAAGDPAVREAAAKALARLRESRDLGLASHMRPPGEPRRP